MATAKKASAKKATAASKKTTQMARGRARDRALISATQKYEAKKGGHSAAAVKAAIEQFGHSRVKVRKALEAQDAAPATKVARKAMERAG